MSKEVHSLIFTHRGRMYKVNTDSSGGQTMERMIPDKGWRTVESARLPAPAWLIPAEVGGDGHD